MEREKGKRLKDIQPKTAVELFQCMKLIRFIEETIARRYSEQKMRCPTHLSIGQEAVAAGVCLALNRDDQVFGTHRSHAHYIAKGGDIKAMIAEIYGKATGLFSSGKGGLNASRGFVSRIQREAHRLSATLFQWVLVLRMANHLHKNGKVCCVFFGDAVLLKKGFFMNRSILLY